MILLQIYFAVSEDNQNAFEEMYKEVYVPALKSLKGYIESSLLKVYPYEIAKGIQAIPTTYNYQMNLIFNSEESRRLWVLSPEHRMAWSAAEKLAERVKWRGYNILSKDS